MGFYEDNEYIVGWLADTRLYGKIKCWEEFLFVDCECFCLFVFVCKDDALSDAQIAALYTGSKQIYESK
jgi:hypothetical protein